MPQIVVHAVNRTRLRLVDMAIPAHCVMCGSRGPPAIRVGIAANAADAVALDAVRSGAVIVASHARKRISSCRATVEVRGARVAGHPAHRVRIDGSTP